MSVRLSNDHLCLSAEFATSFFAEEGHALVSYDEQLGKLMLARGSSDWFRKLHQAQPYLLKMKNSKGDRSVALHALLIDHEIDNSDRELTFELNDSKGWVRIDMKSLA